MNPVPIPSPTSVSAPQSYLFPSSNMMSVSLLSHRMPRQPTQVHNSVNVNVNVSANVNHQTREENGVTENGVTENAMPSLDHLSRMMGNSSSTLETVDFDSNSCSSSMPMLKAHSHSHSHSQANECSHNCSENLDELYSNVFQLIPEASHDSTSQDIGADNLRTYPDWWISRCHAVSCGVMRCGVNWRVAKFQRSNINSGSSSDMNEERWRLSVCIWYGSGSECEMWNVNLMACKCVIYFLWVCLYLFVCVWICMHVQWKNMHKIEWRFPPFMSCYQL